MLHESPEGYAARRRIETAEIKSRRQHQHGALIASAIILMTSMLAWQNHPVILQNTTPTGGDLIDEASHNIGLFTFPAGPLVLASSAVVFLLALRLGARFAVLRAWVCLVMTVSALGITVGEIFQLIVGRRNWQRSIGGYIINPAWANAVGVGVWVALAAEVFLLSVITSYLLRSYHTWSRN